MNELVNISGKRIMEHIEKIVGFGPRVDGSPESIATVNYINSCLYDLGLEIDKIPMEFPYLKDHKAKLIIKNKERLNIPSIVHPRSAITNDRYIEAKPVFVNVGIDKDYEGLDVKGKIVFAAEKEYWEGNAMVPQKYYNAVGRGAKAFVFCDKRDDDCITTWGLTLGLTEIPAIAIPYSYYVLLKNKFKEEPFLVQLTVTGNIIQSEDYIISGKLQSKNPNADIIIINGSHHETVTACPGANDNASGIAIALELLRFFSDRKNNSTFMFISTCGEECGCYGIEEFIKKNKSLLKKIKACFVIDQVAAGNAIIKTKGRNYQDGFKVAKENYDESTKWLVNLVVDSANKLGYYFPVDEHSSEDALGEAGNFLHYEVPSIFLCGWNTDLAYHTAKDNLQMINANALKAIADIIANSCIEIDNIKING